MRLVLHPKVYSDIDEIMGYYERVATPGLAEEYYTELRYFMTKAADKPESFSIRERDAFARGLKSAAAIRADGLLAEIVKTVTRPGTATL